MSPSPLVGSWLSFAVLAVGAMAEKPQAGYPAHDSSATATGSGTKATAGSTTGASAAGGQHQTEQGLTPADLDNIKYTKYVLIALASLAAALFLYRFFMSSLRYVRGLVCLNNEKQTYFRQPNVWFARLKQHLFYAPLLRNKHTDEMRVGRWTFGILPTRIQSILLASIVVMNVVFCVQDLPWSTAATAASLTEIRNRLGIMSVVNMIPLVLFAGRNNPLIGLLNVSFDTFNLMHRWFGRISIAEAVAHTVVHMLKSVNTTGWSGLAKSFSTSTAVMTGLISMVAFAVIFIQALSVIRHAFYETFLHFHIMLVVTAVIALWYHTVGTPARLYVGLVILFWGAERAARLLTLLYRNVGSGGTMALVEALPGDAVRLTITLARPWTFRPGQHMYVTIPSVGLWTSHPFSAAWSEEGSGPGENVADSEKGFDNGHGDDVLVSRKSTMSVVIRRRDGFTNSLWKKASASSEGRFTTSAIIEGPYGALHDLHSYGTLMLFAGGVGITHQVPYVRELVAGYADGTVAARKIVLVWIIQSPEHLEWIRPWMTSILAMDRRKEILRIQLFITRPRSTSEIQSPSATVQMFPGRPNVDTLIGLESVNQVGVMAVSVCGPGALGDEVRAAVRRRQATRSIDLVEESFSW